jgi:F0F1-type ATP synthase membrane subunit c/vacuolar-type H+-ATPase subunit K
MPTDLNAAVTARKREAQAQTQTVVTVVLGWVATIVLIANLILLILY